MRLLQQAHGRSATLGHPDFHALALKPRSQIVKARASVRSQQGEYLFVRHFVPRKGARRSSPPPQPCWVVPLTRVQGSSTLVKQDGRYNSLYYVFLIYVELLMSRPARFPIPNWKSLNRLTLHVLLATAALPSGCMALAA